MTKITMRGVAPTAEATPRGTGGVLAVEVYGDVVACATGMQPCLELDEQHVGSCKSHTLR